MLLAQIFGRVLGVPILRGTSPDLDTYLEYWLGVLKVAFQAALSNLFMLC